MSHLVGKSADERNASAVTLDILASTKDMTAAEVAGVVTTDPSRVSGQKMLFAVRAADTAGRVKVIVRQDETKNGDPFPSVSLSLSP